MLRKEIFGNAMNQKRIVKILGLNILLIASLLGLVTFNKKVLRPFSVSTNFSELLTGSFPNFIAAYLISLAAVSAVYIRKWKRGRLIVVSSAIVVFIILAIEELKPMWGASTHYDSYDIIASGIGSLLAILTYELLNFFKRIKLS